MALLPTLPPHLLRQLLLLLPLLTLLVATANSVITSTNGAQPSSDMRRLQVACESAARVLDASLNSSMPMNTSSLLQAITWQVGASTANLVLLDTSPSTASSTTNSSTTNPTNSTTPNFDAPYFDYTDSLATLALSTIRRGLTFHLEPNTPVLAVLKSLSTAVQTYGLRLRDAGMISSRAQTRTFMAGSTLVDAQGVWGREVLLPPRGTKQRRV